MSAVDYLASGLVGLAVGAGVVAALPSLRRRPAPATPAPPPPGLPAPGLPAPDPPAPDPPERGLDELAGELVDAADAPDSPELRRRLLSIAQKLGAELVRPREEEPFDPRLHVVHQQVPTADPTRHGTIAGTVRPGLRNRHGEVIRSAKVYTYVCENGSGPPAGDGRPNGR